MKGPGEGVKNAMQLGPNPVSRSDEGELMMNQITGTLARIEAAESREELVFKAALTSTQVSPWLERTRWLRYQQIPLDRAAALARLPTQHEEPILYKTSPGEWNIPNLISSARSREPILLHTASVTFLR